MLFDTSDGRATVEDVNEDTFVRFYQYTRSLCRSQTPVVEEEAAPPAPEEPPADEIGWGSMPKKLKKPPKPSKSVRLRQLLDNMTYDTETSRATSRARCEVRPNSNPTEEYTQVFLGHAEMYVFAEK